MICCKQLVHYTDNNIPIKIIELQKSKSFKSHKQLTTHKHFESKLCFSDN